MPSVLSHNLKAGATWGSGGGGLRYHQRQHCRRDRPRRQSRLAETGRTLSRHRHRNRLDCQAPRRARCNSDGHRHWRRRDRGGEATCAWYSRSRSATPRHWEPMTTLTAPLPPVASCSSPAPRPPEPRSCVTRKGGRVGLITWPPGSAVEDIFKTMRPYMPPPPVDPSPSPFAWGREERVASCWEMRSTSPSNVARRSCGCRAERRCGTSLSPDTVQRRRSPRRSTLRSAPPLNGTSSPCTRSIARRRGWRCHGSISSR